METPRFIISALSRAAYNIKGENCGYSIKVYKHNRKESTEALRQRCNIIVHWANQQVQGSAELVYCPSITLYQDQYAIVNVFDPVMMSIERYIKEERQLNLIQQ